MIRTRVGYAGGTTKNPTYRSLGDHSEIVQIDFDPTKITYEMLLQVFWNSHNPAALSWSRQYMSVIFYHNEEQKRLAMESKQSTEARLGTKIVTEIVPFSEFYIAEDYHQKYYLQNESELMRDIAAIYPSMQDFVNSTAAARINGYLGGNGSFSVFQQQIDSFGLSSGGKTKLLEISRRVLPVIPDEIFGTCVMQ